MSEKITNDEMLMLAESTVAENLKIYKKLFIQFHKKSDICFELTKTELLLIQNYIGGTPKELQQCKMAVNKKLQEMKNKH